MQFLRDYLSGIFRPSAQPRWDVRVGRSFGWKEVPLRSPLDWRDNPLTAEQRKRYAKNHEDSLDTAFERLFVGSPTFRALLTAVPEMNSIKTFIDTVNTKTGQFNRGYKDVSVAPQTGDKDKPDLIYILSHEYRHVCQYLRRCGIFGAIVRPRRFEALRHAIEADAYAFSAICTLEVMTHEGRSYRESIKKLQSYGMGTSLKPFLSAPSRYDIPFVFHQQSQASFVSYFDNNNPIKKIYRRKIQNDFNAIARGTGLEIPRVDDGSMVFGVTDTRYVVYTENDVPEHETDFNSAFRRLGYLPTINEDGTISEQCYLDNVKPSDFIEPY